MTTDTPRTDACPHCGAKTWDEDTGFQCGSDFIAPKGEDYTLLRTSTCYANENSQLKAEVERLRTDLCREREAHNKTREDLEQLNIAGATAVEAAKLFKLRAEKAEAENVCLQELIQEFYEWTRRDYPTEAEVGEIMNRYYNLLNK